MVHWFRVRTERLDVGAGGAALGLGGRVGEDAVLDSRPARAGVLGDVVARAVALVDLEGAHDAVVLVVVELVPVREPARRARDGEEHREVICGETHRLVDEAGVEVDVGVELAVNEVLVRQRDALELDGDLDQRLLAEDGENLLGDGADDARTGVVVLVHAVAEAHETARLVLDALDEGGNVGDVADLLEHAHHGLVGAAVAGAVERGDGAGEAGVDVDAGRGEVAHGGRRRVLLVVGVQDEEHVKRARETRVRLEVLVVETVEHVEEVLGVVERVGRVNRGAADAVAVGVGRDGRHGAQRAVDLLVAESDVLIAVLASERRVGLGVEGAHGGDRGHDHAHGVRVVAERAHHLLQLLMDVRVAHHAGVEVGRLLRGRQLAVDEEERDLKEGRLLGELLDGVATVAQDTLCAVNEADLRAGRARVHVSGVEHAETGARGGLDLEHVVAVDGVGIDRQVVLLARAVVSDGKGVLPVEHGCVNRNSKENALGELMM